MARKAAGLSGPVIYCPECHHKTGNYKPKKGAAPVPVVGKRCGGCKARAKAKSRKAQPVSAGPSTSVRTVPGGLPGLGKRHS